MRRVACCRLKLDGVVGWLRHGAVAVLLSAAVVGCSASSDAQGASDDAERPYAGWQERGVSSLSEQDIDELLDGAGRGYALSAELNGYPGPAHMLELADELELDDGQLEEVEAIHAQMQAAARESGEQLLGAEFALDEAFRAGTDASELAELAERAAAVEARLRAVHLEAHLDTTALLNDEQIRRYEHLRGYDGDHGDSHAGHDAHELHGDH